METKGKLIKYVKATESWNEYLLEDGNFLRVKTVIIRLMKTDQLDVEGNPVYGLKTHLLVDVLKSNEKEEEMPKV